MPFMAMDFCDLLYRLRSHVFMKDRDVYLQTNRYFYLGDGTQVTAECLVPIGVIVMWSGAVVDIPSGWSLCDGSGGTPDLRNFFIIGAGDTYNPGDTGGASTIDIEHNHGGATGAGTAHTHASGSYATDSDSHSHGPGTLNTDSDDHWHASGTYAADASGSVQNDITDSPPNPEVSLGSHTHAISGVSGGYSHDHDVDSGTTASDSHSHDVQGTSGSESAHTHSISNALSATQDILNPYYALAFIMRTS